MFLYCNYQPFELSFFPWRIFLTELLLCWRRLNFSSGQNGPCGKPILRATFPAFCPAHFQKAQRNLTQSLKKVGINLCTSSRPTAEFNAILVEYTNKIQVERKKALTKRPKILNSTAENMIDERKIVDWTSLYCRIELNLPAFASEWRIVFIYKNFWSFYGGCSEECFF